MYVLMVPSKTNLLPPPPLFFVFSRSYSYTIQTGICYLILCEQTFSKNMAFAYLQELHQEFYSQYGKKVSTVSRPYPFIEFGEYVCLYMCKVCLYVARY